MKKTLITMFAAASVGLFATSCTEAPKSEDAQVGEEKKVKEVEETAQTKEYWVDQNTSKVTFIGTKPVGRHYGEFKLKDGEIKVEDGKILPGSEFDIDLKSLTITDEGMEKDARMDLTNHLKGSDFFHVDTLDYGVSKFEVVEVKPYEGNWQSSIQAAGTEEFEGEDGQYVVKDPTHVVTGNLTLKGTTKSITFPAKIDIKERGLTARAEFNINRTDWGLAYGNDESLGNKFIRPVVHIGFDIQATPKGEM